MKPNMPVDVPHGAAAIIIKWPELECSMLRSGQRCNNLTGIALIYPARAGYEMVAICEACIDDYGTDEFNQTWTMRLEQYADAGLFPWSKS